MQARRKATLALLGVLLALLLPAGSAQAGAAGTRAAAGVPAVTPIVNVTPIVDVTPVVRILHREHPPHGLPLDAVAPTDDVPAAVPNDAAPSKDTPRGPRGAGEAPRSRGPPQV